MRYLVLLLIIACTLTAKQPMQDSLLNVHENRIVNLEKKHELTLEMNRLYTLNKLESQQEIAKFKLEIENKYKEPPLSFWQEILAIIAVLGLSIAGIYSYLVSAIYKKLSELTYEEIEAIKLFAKEKKLEEHIRKKAKILIINSDVNNSVKSVLEKHKFKCPDIKNADENIETDNYDLIILDNSSNKEDLKTFYDFSKQHLVKEISFLYYGDQKSGFRATEMSDRHKDNINFANSQFTLYTRIIELLKFKEALK